MEATEKKNLLRSLVFPAILLAFLWLIKLTEIIFRIDFSEYGIYPQHIEGLKGILFSPLLHSNLAHLSANSVPLFVLTAGLFYFYEKKALRILIFSWLITGFWVWVFAKDTGIHIGASGIVYALAAFHFVSGLLKKEPRMMAFSMLVVFLYGGLVWGMIPNFLPEKNISWESHLLGMLAGSLLAFFYRDSGPQRKEYLWDEEDENDSVDYSIITDENATEPAGERNSPSDPVSAPVQIVYHITPSSSENGEKAGKE